MHFDSLCAKEEHNKPHINPHILPLYASSSFTFENSEESIEIFSGNKKGYVYGRYANPTITAVENKIAALATHGLNMTAKALLTSSGMSAISTLITGLLKSGDSILTQGNLYGGTTELFLKICQKLGINTILADLKNLEKVEDLLRSDTSIKLLYFETPANPTMACVDIEALASLTKKYNRWSVADNTFCTPYLQQVLAYGVDFSIHSTTKFLNGHGNSIAGVIISPHQEIMQNEVWQALKLMGTNASPFEAWLIHNGMKTLALRMDKHSANALTIAQFLENHPAINLVNYNGLPSHHDHDLAKKQMRAFGGMLSFELKGGLEAGIKFMNSIQFCTLAPTLGDIDTLVLHPASSSHINVSKEIREKHGITDGMIRLSVGIENANDIIADLAQALE